MLTTASFRVDVPAEDTRAPFGAPARTRGRCACGGVTDHTGECASCRTRRRMREAIAGGGGRATAAPERPTGGRAGATGAAARAPDFGRLSVFGPEPRAPEAFDVRADTKVERHPVAHAAMLVEGGAPDAGSKAEREGAPVRLAQMDAGAAPTDAGVAAPAGVPASPDGGVAAAPAQAPPAAPTCTYSITYANLQQLGCGARCGAEIRYDVTRVTATGAGCPATLNGLRLTEAVTTDNGCGPGTVQTGGGCPIGAGGAVSNCTDTYALCGPAAAFPRSCVENYSQRLFVGGQLAETRTITFTITRANGACSGTVRRT